MRGMATQDPRGDLDPVMMTQGPMMTFTTAGTQKSKAQRIMIQEERMEDLERSIEMCRTTVSEVYYWFRPILNAR